MREGIRKYALTIVVAFVTASVAAGGTAYAIIANAHRVDGYHANQLTRLARSSISDNALVGTDGTARSVKIAAPKNGYLFMVASTDAFNGTSSDFVDCFLSIDGNQLASSVRTIGLDTSNPGEEENCSTDAAWPVARGFHTVRFEGADLNPDTVFDEATLEVLFVPFNGRGIVPTPVTPQRVSSGGN